MRVDSSDAKRAQALKARYVNETAHQLLAALKLFAKLAASLPTVGLRQDDVRDRVQRKLLEAAHAVESELIAVE